MKVTLQQCDADLWRQQNILRGKTEVIDVLVARVAENNFSNRNVPRDIRGRTTNTLGLFGQA